MKTVGMLIWFLVIVVHANMSGKVKLLNVWFLSLNFMFLRYSCATKMCRLPTYFWHFLFSVFFSISFQNNGTRNGFVYNTHIFCRHLVIVEQVGTLSVKTTCLEGKEVLRHQKNCGPRDHGLRVTRKIVSIIGIDCAVTFHAGIVPISNLIATGKLVCALYQRNHLSCN